MKEEILELSKRLIKLKTTEDNPEAQAAILGICKEELNGFTIEEFEKNNSKSLLIYNQTTRPEKFRLVLNAHLDVVSAQPHQFNPEEKNNRLYGRGAYDMKAAAAVLILVFKKLALESTAPIAIQLVTDEEIGGFNGTKHQVEDNQIRSDFVITGEPTDLDIKNQAKGILWLKIECKGETAHGAYPWLGVNAAWKMQQVLDKLKQEFPVPNSEVWESTVNLSALHTENDTYNKVPDSCEIKLDIRFIEEDKDTIFQKIKSLLTEDFSIEVIENEPNHFTADENPDVQKLKELASTKLARQVKLIKAQGGSDLRHFSKYDCDGIEFGPTGAGHHSDEEYVEIDSLVTYYEILTDFIKQLQPDE